MKSFSGSLIKQKFESNFLTKILVLIFSVSNKKKKIILIFRKVILSVRSNSPAYDSMCFVPIAREKQTKCDPKFFNMQC